MSNGENPNYIDGIMNKLLIFDGGAFTRVFSADTQRRAAPLVVNKAYG